MSATGNPNIISVLKSRNHTIAGATIGSEMAELYNFVQKKYQISILKNGDKKLHLKGLLCYKAGPFSMLAFLLDFCYNTK